MKLVEINWDPSRRQLVQFGFACLIALPILAWLFHFGMPYVVGAGCIGVAIAALGYLWPSTLAPLFIGLMVITAPIGMVVGEIAMLAIFLLIFVPISLVFRLMRRDSLLLRMDRQRETYWETKSEPKDVSSYYRRY